MQFRPRAGSFRHDDMNNVTLPSRCDNNVIPEKLTNSYEKYLQTLRLNRQRNDLVNRNFENRRHSCSDWQQANLDTTPILQYHVLPAYVTSCDVIELTKNGPIEVPTASPGCNVTVKTENGSVYVNDAKVVIKDVCAVNNGVVHVIDKVLTPRC